MTGNGSEMLYSSFSEGLREVKCPKGHRFTPEPGSELEQRGSAQQWKFLEVSEDDCTVCKIKLYRISVEHDNGEREVIYGCVTPNVVSQYWQAYADKPEAARVIIEKLDPQFDRLNPYFDDWSGAPDGL